MTNAADYKSRASFLLIDDDAGLLKTVAHIIRSVWEQSIIYKAADGKTGLRLAVERTPDVVVLDVILADIDGFEICRRLKNNPHTANIPVVMMSGARIGGGHRARGLDAGADGYLCKPFNADELAAQLRAMLRIRAAERKLKSQNESLAETVRQRTMELEKNRDALQFKVRELESNLRKQTAHLIRADRLAALGMLVSGIAHEINNPNTFIASNLQTLKVFWETVVAPLIESGGDWRGPLDGDRDKADFVIEATPKLIRDMEEGSRRITDIIHGMKEFSVGRRDGFRHVKPAAFVSVALRLVKHRIENANIAMQISVPQDLPHVYGSEVMLSQVMVNLLLNAVAALSERNGVGRINITGYVDEQNMAVISVTDNGKGIDRAHVDKLFDPFFTTRLGKTGSGLGLFVSHAIVAGHDGRIDVETGQDAGSTFTVRIPCADSAIAGEMANADQSIDP